MHEETLKLSTANRGPNHPDTLATRMNLAQAYNKAGQTAEAIAMNEETLELLTQKLGPDHPHTLGCRGELAIAYVAAGRAGEAIALFEETLKLQTAKLGPNHPDTLKRMANLAATYWWVGKLDRLGPPFRGSSRADDGSVGGRQFSNVEGEGQSRYELQGCRSAGRSAGSARGGEPRAAPDPFVSFGRVEPRGLLYSGWPDRKGRRTRRRTARPRPCHPAGGESPASRASSPGQGQLC